MDDERSNLPKQLLTAVGALVVVSAVVGGIVGAVALGAADVVGLAGSEEETVRPVEQSLYIPPVSPSASTPSPSAPSSPASPSGSSTSQAADKPEKADKKREKKDKKKRQRPISLSANPRSVSEMERINLTGRYPGGNGTTLRVQRLEAGTWRSFPVTATVRGGDFATYVLTGRPGPNRFRMLDTTTLRTSNPVTVRVG